MKTETTSIEQEGFEAVLYTRKKPKKRCMIVNIAFGGGSIFVKGMARWLLKNKTDVLGLTVYGSKQTGIDQSEIPLEYIEKAVAWLRARGYEKIGILGLSIGASMAMTAASLMPEDLDLVISLSGFDRVFEGVCGLGTQYPSGHSSFTWRGEEIPYQPFYLTKKEYAKAMKNAKKEHGETYGRMLWEDSIRKEENREALIPVEKIRAPLLMFGAETDSCWDTTGAGERISDRIEKSGSGTPVQLYRYEHGVHFILPECVPFISLMSRMAFRDYKEHPEECRETRKDVQAKIEQALKEWK